MSNTTDFDEAWVGAAAQVLRQAETLLRNPDNTLRCCFTCRHYRLMGQYPACVKDGDQPGEFSLTAVYAVCEGYQQAQETR